MALDYINCDVFASAPYAGNSLAVFVDPPDLTALQMLAITQELRHFETIFAWPSSEQNHFRARVFDLIEELPFAGHPVIGAACTMHRRAGIKADALWTVELNEGRRVTVDVSAPGGTLRGELDQGQPEFLHALTDEEIGPFAEAFGLAASQIADHRPQVISTGLRYLVLPVASGLGSARIVAPDLEDRLAAIGADFAYLFDPATMEGRHWNNNGIVEDIATGSGAGPVGVFAVRHGIRKPDEVIGLRQGHFIGRPSRLDVTVHGTREDIARVKVAGPVAMVGRGTLEVLPQAVG